MPNVRLRATVTHHPQPVDRLLARVRLNLRPGDRLLARVRLNLRPGDRLRATVRLNLRPDDRLPGTPGHHRRAGDRLCQLVQAQSTHIYDLRLCREDVPALIYDVWHFPTDVLRTCVKVCHCRKGVLRAKDEVGPLSGDVPCARERVWQMEKAFAE